MCLFRGHVSLHFETLNFMVSICREYRSEQRSFQGRPSSSPRNKHTSLSLPSRQTRASLCWTSDERELSRPLPDFHTFLPCPSPVPGLPTRVASPRGREIVSCFAESTAQDLRTWPSRATEPGRDWGQGKQGQGFPSQSALYTSWGAGGDGLRGLLLGVRLVSTITSPLSLPAGPAALIFVQPHTLSQLLSTPPSLVYPVVMHIMMAFSNNRMRHPGSGLTRGPRSCPIQKDSQTTATVPHTDIQTSLLVWGSGFVFILILIFFFFVSFSLGEEWRICGSVLVSFHMCGPLSIELGKMLS